MKEFGNFDKDDANTSHFHFPSSRWMRPSFVSSFQNESKKQKEPTHQLARLKKREARSLDEEKTNTHATAGWWSRLEALSFRNDEPHRLNLINRRSFGREGATFTDESRTKRPRRNTKHITFASSTLVDEELGGGRTRGCVRYCGAG